MSHSGNSRYATEYNSETPDFEQKLGVSDEKLESYYVPYLKSLGCNVEYGLDKIVDPDWPILRPAWIDKEEKELRLLDTSVKINDQNAFVEIKDQPQMNQYLSTGCPVRHIRRYIATQHAKDLPIIMSFLDTKLQESGKVADGGRDYDPYVSAYKDEQGFFPYGGLLFDMRVCHRSTCIKEARENRYQLRWECQEDREGKEPLMHAIKDCIDWLKNGKIRKIQGDPRDLDLWVTIQRWSRELGLSPLEVPPNGLIWYTVKEK